MLSTIIGITVLAIIAWEIISTIRTALRLTKHDVTGFRVGVVMMSVINQVMETGKEVLYIAGFVIIVSMCWSMIFKEDLCKVLT